MAERQVEELCPFHVRRVGVKVSSRAGASLPRNNLSARFPGCQPSARSLDASMARPDLMSSMEIALLASLGSLM
jgi:hypothetical protein